MCSMYVGKEEMAVTLQGLYGRKDGREKTGNGILTENYIPG